MNRTDARRLPTSALAAATVLLAIVATVAMAEVAARAAGHRPRVAQRRPEPPMHVADPVLGWKPKPGVYQLGPYVAGAAPIEVTIRDDGARVTGPSIATGKRPELLLVGCSFTMGWAVNDDETWAWRLQELRPDLEVVNLGVGGYGTMQALLLLERIIASDAPRPARVLYGFIDHGLRNVAAPLWLLALSQNASAVATPYATLAPGGHLARHPPEGYPSLPLHAYLASVALVENALVKRRAAGRGAMAPRVTELLIEEMADRCAAAGIEFSLVLLAVLDPLRDVYTAFGREHGIDVIDCNQHPRPDEMVPGELAHPGGAVHRRWGDCIAAALADEP